MLRVLKKQNKRSAAAADRKKKSQSRSEQVRLKKWPEGGLQELRYACVYVCMACVFSSLAVFLLLLLRDMHAKGFGVFSDILAVRQAGTQLNVNQIAYCNRYILASLYTWKENARPMALEHLKLSGKCTMLPFRFKNAYLSQG